MAKNKANSALRTDNIFASGQLLDTSRAAQSVFAESYELGEILAAMGLDQSMRSCAVLAADLSRLAGRATPWTRKYVHSVLRGHIRPSEEFSRSIAKLAQTVDGESPGVAGSAYVRVLADPAQIPEGVLIPSGARVLKCARPGCPVWFVRVHPRQVYHDKTCRNRKAEDYHGGL